MKECIRDLDDVRASRDDLALVARDLEKKSKSKDADILQLHEDLATSERSRKNIEQERDDLSDELQNSMKEKYVFNISIFLCSFMNKCNIY